MSRKAFVGYALLVIGLIAFFWLMVHLAGAPALLNPKGPIAMQQRDLLLISTGLMLIVVVPVFILAAFVSIKYRAGNTTNDYRPEWDSDKRLEAIWWGIPLVLVIVLSVIAWTTAHSLDPYERLNTQKAPVEVQVVALQWKWLFMYPEYGVATINELPIPVGTPINFTIAADAPMNSFWIPELGGQIYAMNGMSTKLHLQADETGDFDGLSSNISGEGFSEMTFQVKARSDSEFQRTMGEASNAETVLDMDSYTQLAKPSVMETESYILADTDLYDKIIAKYMTHSPKEAH